MDGSLLGTRRGAVDADVVAHEVLLGVLARTTVRIDQTAGAGVADFLVDRRLGVLIGVRVDVGLLLRNPLVEVLTLRGFLGGGAETLAGAVLLRRRVSLVEDVVDASVDEGVLRLPLVEVLGLLEAGVVGLDRVSLIRGPRESASSASSFLG